jgi:hypothetical protein
MQAQQRGLSLILDYGANEGECGYCKGLGGHNSSHGESLIAARGKGRQLGALLTRRALVARRCMRLRPWCAMPTAAFDAAVLLLPRALQACRPIASLYTTTKVRSWPPRLHVQKTTTHGAATPSSRLLAPPSSCNPHHQQPTQILSTRDGGGRANTCTRCP